MTRETTLKNLRDSVALYRALWFDESGMDREERRVRPVHVALLKTMESAADLIETDQRDAVRKLLGDIEAEDIADVFLGALLMPPPLMPPPRLRLFGERLLVARCDLDREEAPEEQS